MINRDKVRLMTAMTMYHSRHEKSFRINKYYEYDYIIWHLLLAAARYTVAAFFIFGVIVLFDADKVFYNVNLSGISATLGSFALYFLIGFVPFMILSVYIYKKRYQRAQKDMLYYNSMLKRLARRFHYNDQRERTD